MTEILALLQTIAPVVTSTPLRQLSHIIYGMLISTGRLTMLEISRWTEKGGSYRTIQRLYHSPLPWWSIMWTWFTNVCWTTEHEYILAGDEVVFSKAGQATYGLGRFFSSLQQRVIPSLSFFVFAVIDVNERRSYPLHVTQVVKEVAEAQTTQASPAPAAKRPLGRPKGSRNKPSQPPSLNPELTRIQAMLQACLGVIVKLLTVHYLVLDGHFGNYPSAWMVQQAGLHLISKMRSDAALYEPFTGQYSGHGPHPKYGDKIDVRQMNRQYLKSESTTDGIRTQIYQARLLNKAFVDALNVVVILKTNLSTQAHSHVILFTTDLQLCHDKLIDYYSLRFQIEFNFRDAKQYWGLDDFMNVKQTAVTNAAHLSFFMVNVSARLLQPFQACNRAFSLLDLKAHYRGRRYVSETIKLLPQKPDAILLAEIFEQIARLGMIHPTSQPASTS